METHTHDDELLDQGNPTMGHHSRADATFVLRSLSNGQLIFKSWTTLLPYQGSRTEGPTT
jgi:hypothetical protein